MRILGIIPARYGSKRFPGKPLAQILGHPMIWWVYQQAKKVEQIDYVVVATDDDRIKKTCNKYGIPCMMTKKNCKTGTDRCAEVARRRQRKKLP